MEQYESDPPLKRQHVPTPQEIRKECLRNDPFAPRQRTIDSVLRLLRHATLRSGGLYEITEDKIDADLLLTHGKTYGIRDDLSRMCDLFTGAGWNVCCETSSCGAVFCHVSAELWSFRFRNGFCCSSHVSGDVSKAFSSHRFENVVS